MRINSKEAYQVGHMPIKDSTQAVSIRIEAAHAGIVNGNYIFYTPRALEQGSKSLKEFFKPLQKQHYDKTLGYIYDAVFEPKSNSRYLDNINSATTAKDLVHAVKDYYKSDDYKKNSEGFGVLISKAKLYNQSKIKTLLRKDKGHVSIAGDSEGALCSICSGIVTECDHELGNRYGNEVCFAIADNLELDHISFEEIPANWKTNTLIITDSQLLGKIELIEGQTMKLTLDELKQRLENVEDVLTELGLSDYLTEYKTTLETASTTDFLFPKEKLVPLNSKLAVIVATKLLDLLDETDEKLTVASIVEKEYKEVVGEVALEDAVEALKVVEETQEEVQPEEVETVETTEEETTEVVEQTTESVLEVTDADQFALKIVDSLQVLVDTKFSELEAKINEAFATKDRHSAIKIYEDRYEAFQSELRVAKEAEKQLESELKSSLLTQILLLKKVDVESDYYQKLQGRTLNELKMTLEDHQAYAGSVTFVETKEEVKEETLAVTDSQKEIKTDSVPGAEAIDTMSDSEDETKEVKTALEVQDADTIVNKLVGDIGNRVLDRNEYSALYKTTAMQHGIATAKKLHTVLKQQFKI